jgi:hypothetical protein
MSGRRRSCYEKMSAGSSGAIVRTFPQGTQFLLADCPFCLNVARMPRNFRIRVYHVTLLCLRGNWYSREV